MLDKVRTDFDRIAQFSGDGWSHNSHYHDFLLRHLPSPCANALDVGCGDGNFSRKLATRAGHVLGLDLAPEMIRLARERSTSFPNLSFEVADVMTYPLPGGQFDCIVSIATLHHLPFESIVARFKEGLAPNGVLLILDLCESKTVRDIAAYPFPVLASGAYKLIKNGHVFDPPEVRAAWAEHGKTDHYMRLATIRTLCDYMLPGAQVRHHLFWRYSIVWRRPAP